MADSNPGDSALPPSAKAQGKRPANGSTAPSAATSRHESATPAPVPSTPDSPSKSGLRTRQKRVLPSRSRRGGPGVGSCDVDVMILETRKRRLESEPLIPANTKFLLTTNSALVPAITDDVSSEMEINTQAYGRYFDRPEVQKAYREQQIIQTPEFTQLPEDAIVGGRFRPRGSEEEIADTSDAAYEKRHRKYETFEKRQRLREKEKLKHEQYKLKERIEQLRAMDTAAFLALPASSFSEPPGVLHEGEYDEMETGLTELPGAHINGAAAYNEAERRRQEMLDVAESLEERYRVLLPPDRKWAEKKEAEKREKARRESAGISLEPEPDRGTRTVARIHGLPSAGATSEEDELVTDDEQPQPLPVRPAPVHKQDSDGESEVDFEERDRERSKGLKIRLKFPPGFVHRKRAEGTPSPLPGKKKYRKKIKTEAPPSTPLSSISPSQVRTGKASVRSADGRFLPKHKRRQTARSKELSPHAPPTKRLKTSTASGVSLSLSKTHSSPSTARGECALLRAAERNVAVPTARKTQRHLTAFGVAVPDEIAVVHDYEIPRWCWPDADRTDDEDEDEEDELSEGEIVHGLHGNGFGGYSHEHYTVDYGSHEDWADDLEDTKVDFPDIATLDDD